MKAVASKVSEKNDTLLLPAVDLEDSGLYEIPEPRVITALETYTPSCKWIPPFLQWWLTLGLKPSTNARVQGSKLRDLSALRRLSLRRP